MISEPTLQLDKSTCKANIHRMAEKARRYDLAFKPHMKTHQSAEIGEWIREAGADGITVSSPKMAHYFADAGWENITIAFPAHPGQLNSIDELAASTNLTLLINSQQIASVFSSLSNSVSTYIEIDTGANRTGLTTDQKPRIEALVNKINDSKKLSWRGFYSHPGHSYQCRSKAEIKKLHGSVETQLQELRNAFEPANRDIQVCVGDTPCCSVAESFEGIDAISPGNFMFYDLMQAQIESCEISDIAVAVDCPVAGCYPSRNEIAIEGGAIHFSKERIQQQETTHYGLVARQNDNGWTTDSSQGYLQALSQEHGIVKCGPGTEKYQIGDTITILPVHSCLTANLMASYILDNGNIIHQMGD